jgi:hypothetical protein
MRCGLRSTIFDLRSIYGAARGIRTRDLRFTRAMLYLLSQGGQEDSTLLIVDDIAGEKVM